MVKSETSRTNTEMFVQSKIPLHHVGKNYFRDPFKIANPALVVPCVTTLGKVQRHRWDVHGEPTIIEDYTCEGFVRLCNSRFVDELSSLVPRHDHTLQVTWRKVWTWSELARKLQPQSLMVAQTSARRSKYKFLIERSTNYFLLLEFSVKQPIQISNLLF